MEIPDFVAGQAPPKRIPRRMEGRTFSMSSSSGDSEDDSGEDDEENLGSKARGGPREKREYADGGDEVEMLDGLGLDKKEKKQPVRKRIDGKGMSFPRVKGASRARVSGEGEDGDGEGDGGQQTSDDEDFGTIGASEHDELYDPDLDDLDQQFVDTRRARHAPGYASMAKDMPKPPTVVRGSGGGDSEDDGDDDGGPAAPAAHATGADGGQGDEGASSNAPCEWKAFLAPIGHPYYHNTRTGEVTWVKPKGFKGDGASLAGPQTVTDAVLSCPCCFALLCLDCQQHAKYHNQFRAMFVQNCSVDRSEELRPSGGSVVHPVRCSTCHADVGVMDKADEVFHFFDVIPSSG